MKKQSKFQRYMQWLAHFVELQLFLSLISLPILIAWGLPLSLLTPVANLIFNPVLTAFLFVSSLLFFTELVGIPNGILVWILDTITSWWTWMLNWYDNGWLIGFAKPPVWLLLLIPVAALCITARKKIYAQHVTIIAMSLFFSGVSVMLYMQSRARSSIIPLAYNDGEITILHHAHHTVIIDPGVLGKRASAVSWVNHTLVPELIKKTGHLSISHYIVMQPSIRTFEALHALSLKVPIKNLYIPLWTGTMPRGIWRHFFGLRDQIKKEGGSLIRISTYPRKIHLTSDFVVYIHPLEAQLKYNEADFPALSVYGQMNKESFAVYAGKYKGEKVIHTIIKEEDHENESVVSSGSRGVSTS
jgi:hypothetical protein